MKFTIIDGHPSEKSFVTALVDQYIDGAKQRDHDIRRINVRDLEFDPNLREGYHRIQELEPDLTKAQNDIKWCQHLLLAYPIWWGQMPSQLKGFIDRVFLPGFAFKYHKKGPLWDRLLAGRSARLLVTSDAPTFYNFLIYKNAPILVPKKMILGFCGFKPISVTALGSIKNLKPMQKDKVLKKISKIGSSEYVTK